MYQSTKSVMHADLTCAPGGVIIAVNECRDGHGGEHYYNVFKGRTPREVADDINARSREDTQLDQWSAQYLANILVRHKVIFVTRAPRELVEHFGMIPAATLEEALATAEGILEEGGINGKNAAITVLPESVAVLVRM
jgi:nickel-dependent lactate racemase